MKLRLRSRSLWRAVMLAMTTCCATTLQASYLLEEVGFDNYLNFGRNLAQFKAGATNVAIYNDEGEVISVIEVVPDLSAMRDQYDSSGALAGSQATVITCGHDLYKDAVSFSSKATSDSYYWENYSIIGMTSGNTFPKYDMKIYRLDKIVTDAYGWSLSGITSYDEFLTTTVDGTEPTFFQVGSGINRYYDPETGETVYLTGGYTYLTAGTYDLTAVGVQGKHTFTNDFGETYDADFYSFAFAFSSVSDDNPMPKGASSGDSGSPIIYYNEIDKQWYYVGSTSSSSVTAMTSYQSDDLYYWYVSTYTTYMDAEEESRFLVSSDDDGLIRLVGQDTAVVFTTQGLPDDYRGTTSTNGTLADDDMLMASFDWALTMNGTTFDFTDEVDTGAGVIYFYRDQDEDGNDLEWTTYELTSSNGDGVFNTAGYQVDEQVYLTTSLTGLEGDEWRIVGEVADMRDDTYRMYGGIVEITGSGNNMASLNLGIGVTVILNRSDGYACYDVRLNTQATLILGGENQIGGTLSIGIGGGTLDLNGYDFNATADNFASLDEDANITNSKAGSTSTFSYSCEDENIYQGSFVDGVAMGIEDGGVLNVIFNGGDEGTGSWLLQGVSSFSGTLTIESGTVELSGFQTLFADGTLKTELTTTTDPDYWTYGYYNGGGISIEEGANLAITQYVNVYTDVVGGSGSSFSVGSGTSFTGLITSSGSVSIEAGSEISCALITIKEGGSLNLAAGGSVSSILSLDGTLSMGDGSSFEGDITALSNAHFDFGDNITLDGDVSIVSDQSLSDSTTVTGTMSVTAASLSIVSDNFDDFTSLQWGSLVMDADSTLCFDINLGSMLSEGQYTLLTTSEGGLQFEGSLSLIGQLSSTTARQKFSLSQSGDSIYLSVTGDALTLTWTGTDGDSWSQQGGNWSSTNGDDVFYDLDTALFTGAEDLTVTLEGELNPFQAIIDSSGSYTFTGSGSLSSVTELIVKQGSLILNSSNSFTGGTIVGGQGYTASLTTSTANSLGTGTLTIADMGKVTLGAAQGLEQILIQTGGVLNLQSYTGLSSSALSNEGTIDFQVSGSMTQDIDNSGLVQWTQTGSFSYSTGTFSMLDGSSLSITSGAGNVLITNLSLSGTQTWEIASGQYLRIGESYANKGVLTIEDETQVYLSGGGTVIVDLANYTGSIDSNLEWYVSGGSTIAVTNNGLGGLLSLDNATLQINFNASGGGSSSVGNWTMDAEMDLLIGAEGATLDFYFPKSASRSFGIAGSISGTGDFLLQSIGISSGSTCAYTFSGDMSEYSGTLTLDGDGTTATLTLSNAALHTGGLVLEGTKSKVIFNSSSDQSLVGDISGAGAVQKSGSGTLTLSGDNSYTGGTTLSAGSIRTENVNALGGETGTLSMASGTSLVWVGDLSLSSLSMSGGSLGLVMVDHDSTTLSVTSFTYTSSSNLSISVDLTNFDGTAGDYTLISFADGWGELNMTDLTIVLSDYNARPVSFEYELLDNELILHVIGSTIWDGSDPWTQDFGSIVEFTDTTSGDVTMQGELSAVEVIHSSGKHSFVSDEDNTGSITGSSSLLMEGGTLSLSSANNFSGGLRISGGELRSTVDNSMGTGSLHILDGGSLSLTTAQSFSSTQVDAGGQLTLNVEGSLGEGELTNAGTLTWAGTTDATYTQNINNSGAIVIEGSGNLTLATGTLSMSDGASVNVAKDAGNFLIANLTLSGTQDWIIATGEYLRVGLSSSTNKGVLTISDATTINLSGGGMVIFDVTTTSDYSSELSWVISGGSTIATTSSSFGGSVTLDNGTLQSNYTAVGGGSASYGNWVYSSAMSIKVLDGGGTINFYIPSSATRSLEVSGSISGTGDLTFSTEGTTSSSSLTTTISGDMSEFSGDIILSESALSSSYFLIATTALHSGNISMESNNHLLVFYSDSDQYYAGSISGSGSVAKSGAGTLTLAGESSFTGSVTINNGSLCVANSLALGKNASLNLISGTLDVAAELCLSSLSMSGGSISQLSNLSVGSFSSSGGELSFAMVDNSFDVFEVNSIEISGGILQLNLDLSNFDGTVGAYNIIYAAEGFGDVSIANLNYSITGYDSGDLVLRLIIEGGYLVLDIANYQIWENDDSATWTDDDASVIAFTEASSEAVVMEGYITDSAVIHLSGSHEFECSEDVAGQLTGSSSLDVKGGSLTVTNSNSYTGSTSVGGNGEKASLYATAKNALGEGALIVKEDGYVSLGADQSFASVTVEEDGELFITSSGALGSGSLSNDGVLTSNASDDMVLTQSVSGSGEFNFTGAGNVDFTTSTVSLGDSASITISDGAGQVMIQSLTVSGDQSWNIASGQTLRIGTRKTNNKGTLTVSGETSIELLGGGTVIIDTSSTSAISSNLDWTIRGGSTLASTTAGFGGHIVLDNGTLQANYAADGGGSASVGNWTYGSQMSWEIAEGGGTYQFYFTASNSSRTMSFSGAISGSGDLLLQTTGATDNTTCSFTFSGYLAQYSGNITFVSGDDASNSLIFTTNNLHSGNLELQGSTAAVTYNSQSNQTYGGNISGDGSVTKQGAGTLTLSGDSSYTGGTSIQAGEIRTESATALGTGDVSIEGGTLIVGAALELSELSMSSGAISIEKGTSLSTEQISIAASDSSASISVNGDDSASITSNSLSNAEVNSAQITISKAVEEETQAEEIVIYALSRAAVNTEYTADASLSNVTLNDTALLLEEDVTLEMSNVIVGADSTVAGDTGSSVYATNITVQASSDDGSLSITTIDNTPTYSITTFDGVEVSFIDSLTLQLILTDTELVTFNSYLDSGTYIDIFLAGVTAVDDNLDYSIQIGQIEDGSFVQSSSLTVSYAEFSSTGLTLNIPEPSTATLSLLALAGLLSRRRRKSCTELA